MKEKYDARSILGKRERLWTGLLLALLCGMLTRCGYSLNYRLIDSFENPVGVFVPVFSNNTDEIGAERVFTDALIRELQSRGEVTITSRRPGALEMRGTLSRISYTPTALTVTPFPGGGLQDYRRLPTELLVEAAIELSLVDPKSDKILWTGSFASFRRVATVLSRTHDYDAPSSLALMNQSIVESQYGGIARDIMRDVYDAMVERL